MPDVFISYRRTDRDFVQKLDQALKDRNKDVWIDWEDIPPGSSDFTQDLLRGIESSQALLAVLSPDYLESEYCLGELEYAHQNNKKLIPVVYRAVEDDHLPKSIRHINQIFFNRWDDFDTALEKVIVALDNDWAYHQLHTRLLTRAHEWERAGRDPSFLLRGVDLTNAESWLLESASKDPNPTDLQTEYIFSSRKASVNRQRITIGSLVLGLVLALVLALVALLGFQRAEQNLDRALNTQSLFLADLSRQELEAGHLRSALLLALESLSNYPRVDNSASSKALLNALNNPPQKVLFLQYDSLPADVAWSEPRAVVAVGSHAEVVDTVSGSLLLTLPHNEAVSGGRWNRDRSRILTWSEDGTARIWDTAIQTELATLRHLGPVRGALWSRDESRVLTWSADNTVRLWDNEGQLLASLLFNAPVTGSMWNRDETRIITWLEDGLTSLASADGAVQAEFTMSAPVRGVQLSPDERHLLLWTAAGEVAVWRVDGSRLFSLTYAGNVQGALWNADRVIIWAQDGTIRVLNADGEEVSVMTHDAAVTGAAINRAGNRLLSWSMDNTARLWNLDTGGQILLLAHEGSVNGALWADSEALIATYSNDGSVRLWNAVSGEEVLRLPHHAPVVRLLWREPLDKLLAVSADNRLHVWSTQDGAESLRIPVTQVAPSERVNGIAPDVDRDRYLSWTDNGQLDIRASDGELAVPLPNDSSVNGALWNRDESRVLAWTTDNRVRVWTTEDRTQVLNLPHSAGVRGAAWNADESRILSWTSDGVVWVWDAGQNAAPLQALRHSGSVRGAQWDSAGKRILTWTNNDIVRIWDAESGDVLFDLPHDRGRLSFNVQGASWNRDGTQVLSWAQDGGVRVWSIPAEPNSTEIVPLLTLQHSTLVRGAAWNPAETLIVTWAAKGDDVLRIWDAASGEVRLALPHGSSSFGISGAMWSRETNRLLSWSSNGLVRVWDAMARQPDQASLLLLRHNRNVLGATWNTDETRILTWPSDGTMRVWDGRSGDELFLLANDDVVQNAFWDQDEDRIIARIRGGAVRIWIVDVETLIAIGRNRRVDPLSNDERRAFFLSPLNAAPATATPPPAAY